MIFLSTAATVIASQALITGLFSQVYQCIPMDLWLRTKIFHTSKLESGQIYVPAVNWFLWIGTLAVVLMFKTSDALGAAYGIAVSGTMLITTILMYFWLTKCYKLNKHIALGLAVFFGAIDLGFFAGNLMKFVEGGYLPLTIGLVMTFIMTSWRSGRLAVRRKLEELSVPVDVFMKRLTEKNIVTVPGTAVFLTKVANNISPVWAHHVEENGAMHEKLVLLNVQPMPVPIVFKPERVVHEVINERIERVTLKVGFMQTARIHRAIAQALGDDVAAKVHYFIGHEIVRRKKSGSQINYASGLVFTNLHPHAARITDFFRLSGEHIEEIGLLIEI
jgi:KUP system potassium uptake protein